MLYGPPLNDEGLLRLPEILRLIPVGKSTWWAGVKSGRYLFTSVVLRAFMKARMAATKRPLEAGEIFCVACKCARVPISSAVHLRIVSATSPIRRWFPHNIDAECGFQRTWEAPVAADPRFKS
jgi:hypothetical protein